MALAYGNSKSASSFWRFDNWKMYVVIIVAVLVIPVLLRYLKKQVAMNQEQNQSLEKQQTWLENQNPATAQAKANKITTRKDVQSAAKDLSHHLGTMYSDRPDWNWYNPFSWPALNPKGWTENDGEVARILIYQQLNFSLLERLYNEIYTNGRNLRNDVLSLLDASELKEVQKRIKL